MIGDMARQHFEHDLEFVAIGGLTAEHVFLE
jgi:hypothetical protein